MKPLSEVSWDELQIGDEVLSPNRRHGVIVNLEVEEYYSLNHPENYCITIKWDYLRDHSRVAHHLLKKVLWYGEDQRIHKTITSTQ